MGDRRIPRGPLIRRWPAGEVPFVDRVSYDGGLGPRSSPSPLTPMLPSTSATSPRAAPTRPLSVWLAGRIDWPGYATLAERLTGEVAAGDRNPTLVLHELEPCITIGRAGSRTDVRLDDDDLRSRQLPLRFTGRGGGAVLHGPGQVCVSLFARLADLGLADADAGSYLARLEISLTNTIRSLRCGPHRARNAHGILGRTGLLAAIGVAIRRGCVAHGAFLNVSPDVELHHRITTLWLSPASGGRQAVSMSSIEADVQRMVRLQDARTALVEHVAEAFGFQPPLIHAGFPVASLTVGSARPECASRVG
jgi:lipoyl(octanoyl) transferase